LRCRWLELLQRLRRTSRSVYSGLLHYFSPETLAIFA
jgi:hypothetical protein